MKGRADFDFDDESIPNAMVRKVFILMPVSTSLPVAIVGAGPVGLAAASHLAIRNEPFVILEAGTEAGASIRNWGHVRLFSPWIYNIDSAARSILDGSGWEEPDPEAFPTGNELVDAYLAPLAAHDRIAPHIRYDQRVTAISRDIVDKMKDTDRADRPFVLQTITSDGEEDDVHARAVIDASGTWTEPNPIGANGLHVPGERGLSDVISYGIPDILGTARDRYAGKRVLVLGSGHSAFNALADLAVLAHTAPETQILWAIRRSSTGDLFGGGANDSLPARGALGARIRELTNTGAVTQLTNVRVIRLRRTDEGINASTPNGDLPPVDEIIVATGFRPNLEMLRELRLMLDPAVESPAVLAPMIDPNLHSCGTVRPHGYQELSHAEPDFYVAGMKSYGRAPTFLMLTGYEQVRSIVSALTGDFESARKVELVLPETGVCSISRPSSPGDGCCGTIEESTAISVSTGCCTDPTVSPAACCGGTTSEPIQIAQGGKVPVS